MKKISIVSPCFNEINNIGLIYSAFKVITASLLDYSFEIIFIDNCSTDGTKERLRELAANDPDLKIIFNVRNFGHNRSPYWGLLQASGDAVIIIASDLQEPPECITQLILEWEKGWKVVLAQNPTSEEGILMKKTRETYYKLLNKISTVELIQDANGFGIYDKKIIEYLSQMNDPNPYIRGMVCEIGYPIKTITYTKKRRQNDKSKNKLYQLYDQAMLGITSHSIVPLRIASFVGYLLLVLSFFAFSLISVHKLNNWQTYFFWGEFLKISHYILFGLVFIFIGLLGEYNNSILSYVRKRHMVIEEERINF